MIAPTPFRTLLLSASVLAMLHALPARAQDTGAEAEAEADGAEAPADPADDTVVAEADAADMLAEEDDEPVFTEEDLDDLVGWFALYPDAIIAQILVASTEPLDVVRAQSWIEANKDLEEAARL
ncbi:MAG: DUF3300 domain-containing protein, partial [Pseudomonadota bacterium]